MTRERQNEPTIVAQKWMPGDGVVAERTNVTINALLDWAAKSDVSYITRSNMDDAIRDRASVNSDDTVSQYVDRIASHGPFELAYVGKWSINWEAVERDA